MSRSPCPRCPVATRQGPANYLPNVLQDVLGQETQLPVDPQGETAAYNRKVKTVTNTLAYISFIILKYGESNTMVLLCCWDQSNY